MTDADLIIEELRKSGLNAVADRLSWLQQLAADDPDERPMDVDSLRELAAFLVSERRLPHPQIGVSPDGLAQAEWRLPGAAGDPEGGGILALEFLRSGLIRFAGMSAGLRVSGTLSKAKALQAVQPFIALLSSSHDRRRMPADLGPITKQASGLVTQHSHRSDRELIEEALEEKYLHRPDRGA